jgi:DNA-directed RNA polymerase specialized sigma24 family protein
LTDGERRTATQEQVRSALEGLDDDALLKLRHVAIRMILGTSYRDPQDLVHDALESALQLRRLWNMEQTFHSFLCGAMKSIASNDRHSLPTRSERSAATLAGPDEVDHDQVLVNADAKAQVQALPAARAAEEEQARRRQRANAVYALFAGDDEITMMLMAMEDGCRGKEIERQCGMTPRQHETTRRRMNRQLAAAYPIRKGES